MDDQDTIKEIRKYLRSYSEIIESKRYFYLICLLVLIGLVSFVMTFLLLYINPKGIDIRYTVTCGALIPSTIIYLLISRAYLVKNKKMFADSLCKAAKFNHRENGFLSVNAASRHKILPEHSRSTMDTGIQGNFNGTTITVQELILTALKQDPDNKKKQKEFLRFWGLLVRLQLKRPMQGHTVILPEPVMRTFFSGRFSGYEKVALNDGKFSRFYDVRTTDKIDARFILNSSFQENFTATAKALKSYWAIASFNESEVLLAFQRFRPLIKPTPLWRPVTEDGMLEIVKELESIARLINVLKANPQISI